MEQLHADIVAAITARPPKAVLTDVIAGTRLSTMVTGLPASSTR